MGVYTQNLVCAAPVELDRSRTPSDRIRAVVICSGVANACTGRGAWRTPGAWRRLAAAVCGAEEDQALVLSTGVIGAFLPMDKIEQGIAAAAVKLGDNEACLHLGRPRHVDHRHRAQAGRPRGDHRPGGKSCVTGMAKGAAMMGPNMATMLALIMTDAPLDPAAAQAALRAAADESFNCMSVDGHMSTNDTVLLVANGAAGGPPLAGDDLAQFRRALDEVCVDLAKAIAGDGEGATHLITIDIGGCADRAAALTIAKTVANSPLVKTAIHGADPNWGRIVSAAGYAGVPFDPAGVTLHLNGCLLYRGGAPVDSTARPSPPRSATSATRTSCWPSAKAAAGVRFWTTDLTAEYVRLNADYHT